MSSEFERCRRTIGRREVTITSWIDSRTQTWNAGAPAYVHLMTSTGPAPNGMSSRNQAIEKMVVILTDRLSAKP